MINVTTPNLLIVIELDLHGLFLTVISIPSTYIQLDRIFRSHRK